MDQYQSQVSEPTEDTGRSVVRASQSQSSVCVTSAITNIANTSPVTSSKSLSPQTGSSKTRGSRGTGSGRRVPGFPQRVTSVTSDNGQLTGSLGQHKTVDIELETKHNNTALQLIGMIFTRISVKLFSILTLSLLRFASKICLKTIKLIVFGTNCRKLPAFSICARDF